MQQSTKALKDMTVDELNALPEQPFADRVTLPVIDGKATLPNGRVLTGLIGTHVHIPVPRKARVAAFAADDPAFWSDVEGRCWRPVLRDDGSWAKTRVGF